MTQPAAQRQKTRKEITWGCGVIEKEAPPSKQALSEYRSSSLFLHQEEQLHHFLCRAGKVRENEIDGKSDFLSFFSTQFAPL